MSGTIAPGFVAEYHINPDSGQRGFKRCVSIQDFLTAWDYALADTSEEFAALEANVDPAKKYLGVVHVDGAYLLEVRQ